MNLLELQSDPALFRRQILIDTDKGAKSYSQTHDKWQESDHIKLDSGWKRSVLGAKQQARYQRAWLERPRGHSKSLDLAMMSSWALFASRRPLSGIAAAGDFDQARLLRDAIGKLVYHNPWLQQILEVQNTCVINTKTGSSLDIIASDAPSSYGVTPDFVICDELCHWRKRDLWDSLLSSSAKRSTCMLVCITNAGIQDDWQYQLREAIRTDPGWYFSRLDGPCASWITPKVLAEQQRLLPPIAYRRLWLNEWTSGGGDALTTEDIDAAFDGQLQPHTSPQRNFEYVAGLDLGVSRDASAVALLAVYRGAGPQHGHIALAATRIWKPKPGAKVNLQEVEDFLIELHCKFEFKRLNYDPWQALHLASRLQADGAATLVKGQNRRAPLPAVEVPPTGTNLQAQASCVIETFNDRRIKLFPDVDLKRDLHRLRVEERSYGFRLTSPRDEQGHGDMASAFSLALLAAVELARTAIQRVGSVYNQSQHRDLTPFQRTQLEFQERQRAYQLEMELLNSHRYNHNEPFVEAMRGMRRE